MESFNAGNWLNQGSFKNFEPTRIKGPWKISDPKVIDALSKADRQIGRLDMFSEYFPNLDLYVEMHVTREATQSSRIEGIHTGIEEAILPEEEVLQERRDDWREVKNYIRALNTAIQHLDTLPFSTRLLREAHATLMEGVLGEHKAPGEFRHSQNWIGGSNPGNARFVPPGHESVPELMGDLELFAYNSELDMPPLLKVAIMHYQFETIHPFLDGNGRIGRLMIPLYLVNEKILKQPVLYLSDYLEQHREEYYDRLTRVRERNAIADWLIFFLDGISETAAKGVLTFNAILQFQKRWEEHISKWKPHSHSGMALFRHLFRHPCVDAAEVAKAARISPPTAYKLIDRFITEGLLREITGARRGRLFVFEPFLKIFQNQ